MLHGTRLDATTLVLVALTGLLWWTIREPYAQAHHTATLERSTLQVAHELFALASETAGSFEDTGVRATFTAEATRRCAAAGLAAGTCPEAADGVPATGLVLQNELCLFLVTRTPPLPDALEAPAALPPEVWAWPRDAEQGVSTVFCVSPEGTVANRNITERYLGGARPPEPGTWRSAKEHGAFVYLAFDGGFWRPQPD